MYETKLQETERHKNLKKNRVSLGQEKSLSVLGLSSFRARSMFIGLNSSHSLRFYLIGKTQMQKCLMILSISKWNLLTFCFRNRAQGCPLSLVLYYIKKDKCYEDLKVLLMFVAICFVFSLTKRDFQAVPIFCFCLRDFGPKEKKISDLRF